MEAREYLKKNVKMASKNLFTKFRQYACFFLLLFLLQSLLCTTLSIRYNYERSQKEILERQFTNNNGIVYHVKLLGLNSTQYAALTQYESRQSDEDRFFQIAGGEISDGMLETGTEYSVYDVEIAFIGDNKGACYDEFCTRFYESLKEEGEFDEYITPLLNYELNALLYRFFTFLAITAIFALAVAVLRVLHYTVSSFYSFAYGIYMSFGADFGKLFSASFWEMLILNLILIVPSAILSNIISLIIVKNSGLGFVFCPYAIPLSFVLTLAAALAASFATFGKIASKPPVKLIVAEDNSDLICSPRTSTDIRSFSFSAGLEKLSLFRFRNYLLRLTAFTVAFTLVFASAAYIADICEEAVEMPTFEYELEFEPTITEIKVDSDGNPVPEDAEGEFETVRTVSYEYTCDSSVYADLHSISGVVGVCKESAVNAYDCNSHIFVDSKSVKRNIGYRRDDETGFSDVDFLALDADVAEWIDFCGYAVSGSLDDVINDSSMIAVSDSVGGKKTFGIKVGDKIRVAVDSRLTGEEEEPAFGSDKNNALSGRLKNYAYVYRTFTVGAVISGVPSDTAVLVYMNSSAYKTVTHEDVAYDEVKLVVDDDISDSDFELLGINLRNARDYYSNLKLTNLDSRVDRIIEKNKNRPKLLDFFGICALAAVPAVEILSLSIFYRKRQEEFDSYIAMGAVGADIKKIFFVDGLFVSALTAFSHLISATLISRLVWSLMNIPNVFRLVCGSDEIVCFEYNYPFGVIIAGMAVAAIGAFAGVWLSCRRYFRENGLNDRKNKILRKGKDKLENGNNA